jgi:putative sterol carrier protein
MSYETVKAHLNLYAVLQNLEELVVYDDQMREFVKDWNLSIQFSVLGGPKAYIVFKNGTCTVGRGVKHFASIVLFFVSSAHLNNMFDGKASPIPLRGFTKLGFLLKKFSVLTDRLVYYLKPTDELLKDKKYLELNTRFTLATAAFAAREIALHDPVGKLIAAHIRDGAVQLMVQPDGPGAYVVFEGKTIEAKKGMAERPMAVMAMKGLKEANAFLNNKVDAFTAVVSGDVVIKGQMGMLDNLGLVLDRIPAYLS